MKVGIVGVGKIVQEFLSISNTLEEVEIRGICGLPRHASKLKDLQANYGINQISTDYEHFLNSDIETVYLGLPNQLHFEYTMKALEAGKHVIVEKPMATQYEEAEQMVALAKSKKLFLFEAVTTQYLQNYQQVKNLLPMIGDLKIVSLNYSQYSSRYDDFLKDIIRPAFDPKCGGGALMDINFYNLNYVVGLFGKPEAITYSANWDKGIDTSGILWLKYPNFQCVLVGAKDCNGKNGVSIEGTKGYIYQETSANVCGRVSLCLRGEAEQRMDKNQGDHRMISEWQTFTEWIQSGKLTRCYEKLEISLSVSELLTQAQKGH